MTTQKKTPAQDTDKFLKGMMREKAKTQGFYDGRFRSRITPDKKKKASAEACRNIKKQLNNLLD